MTQATGYLTTHVLDTARGEPAEGIEILLFRVSGNSHRKIATAVTNADGRTDQPILPADAFKPGTYELIFATGDYLRRTGQAAIRSKARRRTPIDGAPGEAERHRFSSSVSSVNETTIRGPSARISSSRSTTRGERVCSTQRAIG